MPTPRSGESREPGVFYVYVFARFVEVLRIVPDKMTQMYYGVGHFE